MESDTRIRTTTTTLIAVNESNCILNTTENNLVVVNYQCSEKRLLLRTFSELCRLRLRHTPTYSDLDSPVTPPLFVRRRKFRRLDRTRDPSHTPRCGSALPHLVERRRVRSLQDLVPVVFLTFTTSPTVPHPTRDRPFCLVQKRRPYYFWVPYT